MKDPKLELSSTMEQGQQKPKTSNLAATLINKQLKFSQPLPCGCIIDFTFESVDDQARIHTAIGRNWMHLQIKRCDTCKNPMA